MEWILEMCRRPRGPILSVVTALALFLCAGPTSAQDDMVSREFRLSASLSLGPLTLAGSQHPSDADGALEFAGVGVGGHGGLVRLGVLVLGSPVNANEDTTFRIIEANYVRRWTLVGDLRLGIALDLEAGLGLAPRPVYRLPSCDYGSACRDRPTEGPIAVDAMHLGPVMGVALRGALYGFDLAVGGRYMPLAALASAGDGRRAWQHMFVAEVRLGVALTHLREQGETPIQEFERAVPAQPGLSEPGVSLASPSTACLADARDAGSVEQVNLRIGELRSELEEYSGISPWTWMMVVGGAPLAIGSVFYALGAMGPASITAMALGSVAVATGLGLNIWRTIRRVRLRREIERQESRRILLSVTPEGGMATLSWRL